MRDVPLSFPGVCLRLGREALVLRSERLLHVLASTVAGGGRGRAGAMLSLRVPLGFDCADPRALLRRRARDFGVRGRFVGFLTAVDLDRAAVGEALDPRLLVVVTAGTGNATAPGRSPVAEPRPGTINIIALVEGRLSPGARAGLLQVITEAKTLALVEAGIRTPEGGIATGTSTDAVAAGWTGTGAYHEYAGPATPLGHALGRLVTEGVRLSLAGGGVLHG